MPAVTGPEDARWQGAQTLLQDRGNGGAGDAAVEPLTIIGPSMVMVD